MQIAPKDCLRHAVLFTLVLFSGGVLAEREWRIEPSLGFRAEAHNRSGVNVSDGFLTELTPSIALRYRIAETSASLSYTPRLIFTDLSDPRSTIVHALSSQASTQLASGRITLGAQAAVGEQSLDPLSTYSVSSIPNSNRARFYNLGVNAAMRENLAPGLFGEVRADYTHSGAREVSGAATSLLNNNATSRWRVAGDIKPTSRNPEFGWFSGAEYSARQDESQATRNAYRGYIGALWNPTTQLNHEFRLGYEQREFVAQTDENRGVYGEASVQWRPSPLTEVRASLGKHYFGTTGQLAGRIRGNRAAFEFSLGRQLVNSQESAFFPQTDSPLALLDRFLTGTISDATARSQEVTRLANVFGLPAQIDNARYFYVDRFVLEQSARFSGLYTLPRISFNAAVSYRKTNPGKSQLESISLQSVVPLTELQANAGAAYRLAERSTIRLDMQGSRSERQDSSEKRNRFRTQATFSQIWTKAISTGATVFYERESGETKLNDFTDRGISVFARYAFN